MHNLIKQMVAYTNVTKVLLLQQTVRTAQLLQQVKKDEELLTAAVEHIQKLEAQLAEYARLAYEANVALKAMAEAVGLEETEERYG